MKKYLELKFSFLRSRKRKIYYFQTFQRKNKSGEEKLLGTTGLFVFVGHNVNNSVLKTSDGSYLCDLDENGQVIVDLKMRTSLKGLYVAGDIRIDAPKQVVSAASDGAIAALEVISYIQELD